MTIPVQLNHCRVCGKHEIGSFVRERLLKYSTRHYAHFHCFLNQGKNPDTLREVERLKLDRWIAEHPFFKPVKNAHKR